MAFFPTSLSGLAAWYDASDSATVTGADPVTQWSDKSGNARHLSHATLGPQHDAVQNVMQLRGGAWSGTSVDTLDMPAMTVRSVFVFMKAITPQTASSRYHALLGHTTNTDSLFIDLSAGNPASFGIRAKGGLNKAAVNGEDWIAQSTADTTVPCTINTTGDIIEVEYASGKTGLIWFGATGTTRQFGPNCDVGEIIIFDRPLTGSEKALIEGYLAHKWERADLLPAAHPYKVNPPGMAEPESAGHAHSASQPVLTIGGSVTVHDGSHGHDADEASLTAFGLTLDDIADHRIFQRNGTEAAIALSGGYTGAAPAGIEARVMHDATEVLGWTVLSAAVIGAGNWAGMLESVPQGGMYRVEVRSRSGVGDVIASAAGVNQWGVGDVYGVIGSSSAERWFTIGTGYSPHTLLKVHDGAWKAASPTGAAAVTFGNQAIANGGAPVGLLDFGVGGTTIAGWSNDADASYVAFRNAMIAAGGIRAVIAVVGMNDARAGSIASQAGHEAKWRTLIANIRPDAGDASLPVLIWGAQRCAQPGMDDEQFAWLRDAELAVGEDANVHLAATTVDLPLIGDNLHLSEAGMAQAAARVARAAGALFYDTELEWRRPEVESVRRVDDSASDVTITHRGGDDLVPASGITGFQISTDDFGSLLTISSAARQAANVVRLHHAATGGAAAKVRYQYGAAPDVSGAVNDNNALPLPLAPMRGAMNVLTGDFVLAADGLHGLANSAPSITAIPPAAWLVPQDTLHSIIGQTVTLLGGHVPQAGRVLRVRAETHRLAVGRD